jgi:hypothetical protein
MGGLYAFPAIMFYILPLLISHTDSRAVEAHEENTSVNLCPRVLGEAENGNIPYVLL